MDKVDDSLMADQNEIDRTLFNNYILSEIKSQEDTARQLIMVCAVLIGLYIALITNSQV